VSDWIREFSCPQGPADERIFDTVVTTHGSAIAALLMTRYREEIDRKSEGLLDFVLKWTETPATLETAWDLAFGSAQLALKSGRLDPCETAVRLALRLTETGHRGSWRGTLPPSTIRIGSTLVQSTEEVQVDCVGAECRIRLGSSNGTQLNATLDTNKSSWLVNGGESLHSVGIWRSIYLLPGYALPDRGPDEELLEKSHAVSSVDAAMIETFAGGIRSVGRDAPGYLPWIERVLRGIVVCPLEDLFRAVSGSGEDAPGIIHASHPLPHMDIAEIVIHECAHQYFYMLQRVGPLDDGTDRELYWSPPIRMKRPLGRILMAYHALANVRLFYECVRAAGGSDIAYVEANEQDLIASIAALSAPLRNNPALTALGRGLYEPLAERLRALSEQPA
jgi:hypothetical protein